METAGNSPRPFDVCLRELFKSKQLTAAEVAEDCKLDCDDVTAWLDGARFPNWFSLRKVMITYGWKWNSPQFRELELAYRMRELDFHNPEGKVEGRRPS